MEIAINVFYTLLIPRSTSRGFLPVVISHYDSPLMCQVTWQSPHSSPTISMDTARTVASSKVTADRTKDSTSQFLAAGLAHCIFPLG